MSLYNMLFGANPAGPAILATLGLKPNEVGRYRDCYVEKTELGTYQIVLHTRNGGGNRECWDRSPQSEQCACPGCVIEYRLPKHPLYLGDADDDFDCTYADIRFALPDDYAPELKALADQQEFVAPSEKWQALFAAFEEAKS